jgi:uncharacterized protein (TIGR02246 family)
MNKILLTGAILLSFIAQAIAHAGAPSQDEIEIRDVQARQADAWNRHDATAYARLFSEEGDVVNVLGWWWRGRPAIESNLAAAFSFAFRDSTLTITEVDVQFLEPSIAIVHVRWTMQGATTPPGMPEPRQGIQLQVLKKHASKWMIETFQNTNALPEVPFPTPSSLRKSAMPR